MKKRWKKISKMLAGLALAVTCVCAGSGTTVLANVNQAEVDAVNAEAEKQTEAPAETEPPAETEKPADAEKEEPVIDRSGTFSVPGNGEVVDHITDGSSKEFYTIRTANNNIFYMVVDHAAASENVYMLSTIDEGDLSEFIKESEKEAQKETQPPVILEENVQKEPETEAPKTEMPGNVGGMAVIVLLAAGGAAAYYFLKIKPKKEEEKPESENLELGDGLETINEDEDGYYLDEEDE